MSKKIKNESDLSKEKLGQSSNNKPIQKKSKRLLWPFILGIVLFFAFTGVVIGVVARYRQQTLNKVNVTFDPIIVSSYGETHLPTPQVSIFDRDQVAKDYVSNFEVSLGYKQSFIYTCTISNDSQSTIECNFDLDITDMDNVTLTYSINDEEELPYSHNIDEFICDINEKYVIKVFLHITDIEQNAFITGSFNLSIKEIKVGV